MTQEQHLVAWLTDWREQPWTRTVSYKDAATRVLTKMASLGMIEGKKHPHTWSDHPTIFRVDGKLYGRTDGIDDAAFEALPKL